MAFFTRKGLTVPDFPSDAVLTEEVEDIVLPPLPPTILPPISAAVHRSECNNKIAPKYVAPPAHVDIVSGSSVMPPPSPTPVTPSLVTDAAITATNTDIDDDRSRFEYVVDRTYGVEV